MMYTGHYIHIAFNISDLYHLLVYVDFAFSYNYLFLTIKKKEFHSCEISHGGSFPLGF